MTAAEACEMVAAATVEISHLRRERDAYRNLAIVAIHHGHDLHVANQRLTARNRELLAEWRLARGFDSDAYWRDRQALELDWDTTGQREAAA